MPDVTTATDAPPIYARQPDEPPKHYEWFHVYLLLGPGRSLLGAYKKFYSKSQKVPISPSPAWKSAFEKRNWKERAQTWDAERRIEAETQELERRRVWNEEFGRKHEERIESVMKAGDAVEKTISQMLAWPLQQQNGVHGAQPFIIEPSRWTLDTAVRMMLARTKSYETSLKMHAELEKMRSGAAAREQSAIADTMMERARVALEAVEGESTNLTPTQQRERENIMLDALEASLLSKAQRGVSGAVDRLLHVARRRAALNGLDKPFDPNAEQTVKKRRDLSGYSQDELDLMEEMFFREGYEEEEN